jgi:hypothetical protein
MPSQKPQWAKACARCRGTVFASDRAEALRALCKATPQLPGCFVLLFNLLVSAGNHCGKLVLGRILPSSNHTMDSDALPEILAVGYVYPKHTPFVWMFAGVLAAWHTGGFEEISVTAIIVCACAAFLSLRRLWSWRHWVRDLMGEAHRVQELQIVDDVVADCSSSSSGDLPVKVKDRPGLRILDFGAGKGKTTQHILSGKFQCEIEAIDIQAHPPHVKSYDGQVIPYPPDSFDLAIALYVFHHVSLCCTEAMRMAAQGSYPGFSLPRETLLESRSCRLLKLLSC